MITTIQVEGMSCQHCVKAVEGALKQLEGVSNALVSLEKNQVDITFDPKKTSIPKMREAIENQGYEVI